MAILTVEPCTNTAARYAVEHWHYSGKLPRGQARTARYGVWEDGRFVGAIIFGPGASIDLHRPYGIDRDQVGELLRVALGEHERPTSEIVSRAVAVIAKQNTGLRLLVSFADPFHGHVGTLYQAMNWLYTGRSSDDFEVYHAGRWWHSRQIRKTEAFYFGKNTRNSPARLTHEEIRALPRRARPGKYRYLKPLDRAMRRKVAPLALPYPRGSGLDGELPADQAGGAGSTPAIRSMVDT